MYLAVLTQLAIAVSSLVLIAGVARCRVGGAGGPVHHAPEAAFLGGGPGRVADVAITALHEDGRLALSGPGVVTVVQSTGRNPLEQALLDEADSVDNAGLHTLRSTFARNRAVHRIGDGLARRGLMINPGRRRFWRRLSWVQGAVCGVCLPVAIAMTVIPHIDPPSTGTDDFSAAPVYAVGFLVGAAVGVVCARLVRSSVTRAGRRALAAFRRSLPLYASAADLVAVHGVRGVPDQELKAALREAARARPTFGSPSGGGWAGVDTGTSWWGAGCGTVAGSDSGVGGGGCGGGSGGCGGSSS